MAQDQLDLQTRLNLAAGSGARALGMGGAFLARADDATAASWNPAGLSYLRLPEFSFAWAETSFGRRAETPEPGSEDFRGRGPDFAAATYPISIGSVSGAVQLSFQRVISFSGDRTVTTENPTRASSRGGFDALSLGSGWRLSRQLRVGVTVNRWIDGYRQTLDRTGGAGGLRRIHQVVVFDLAGWNGNLGLIWSPWESLSLAGVAKTPFHGTVHLRRLRDDTSETGEDTSNIYWTDDVTLEFPGAVGGGVSWRPESPLTFSLDYTRSFWSGGRIRDFFVLPGRGVEVGPQSFDVLPYPNLSGDGNQKDAEQIRAGVEYVVIGRRVKWPIRLGYFRDKQYFPAAGGDAPTYTGLTAGTGINIGPLLLDVAYIHESGDYLDQVEGNPRVSVRFDRVLVSLIYRHSR